MYKAFLSYAQLKEYFTILIENGPILEYDEGRRFYRTTEKGIRLLQITNQFDEIISVSRVNRK